MFRTTLFVLVASAMAACVVSGAPISWDSLKDGKSLGAAHKMVAEEAMGAAPCYGGCERYVAECLAAGDDPIGERLANFICRRAATNQSTDKIVEEVRKRKLSVKPPKRYEPETAGLQPSGEASAPVQVVIFADFQCPYCKVAATALRKLSQEMPDRVAVYFKNYPLKQHARSIPAALAYLAAERQGKGWEMHDLLFEGSEDHSTETLEQFAEELGLDMDLFREEMTKREVVDRLRAEKTDGIRCGIRKSPGILVNGARYFGTKTAVELRDRIEEEFHFLSLQESPTGD